MEAIGGIRAELEWFREQGRPILGICAGMHAMCDHSEEGDCDGLGWFHGNVIRLAEPIPRQGWMNTSAGCMYFSHSYGIEWPRHEFLHGFAKDNLKGVQYHPEKSQADGLKALKDFLEHFPPWTP